MTAAPIACAALLACKLVAMLFGTKPYRVRREGLVDKWAQPAVHALYVGVFAFALIVSLSLSLVFLWALINT